MIYFKKWGLVMLVLCPVLGWGGWTPLRGVPGTNCYPGSAMCYGQRRDTNHIWLMHGAADNEFRLDRYDFSSDSWAPMTPMPQLNRTVGPGGALVYVADPYAPPGSADGWIYALKGNDTSEFYRYNPATNTWLLEPPIPDNVTDGGALCFGGFHKRDGQLCADVYAFTGTEIGGAGRFFRYSIPQVLTSSPLPGTWTELAAVNVSTTAFGVYAGASLAWYNTPSTAYGTVYAFCAGGSGNLSNWLLKYDPVGDTWGGELQFAYYVLGGGAMSAGIGDTLWCFRGGTGKMWWLYDIGDHDTTYFTNTSDRTWAAQKFGAAMCFNGSNVYAEVGTDDGKFERFDSASDTSTGGGQGHAVGISCPLSVTVRAGQNAHTFCVANAASGPVTLRVADASGRTVGSVRSRVLAQTAELVWNSGAVNSGVYLYSVETPGARATGKLVIAR